MVQRITISEAQYQVKGQGTTGQQQQAKGQAVVPQHSSDDVQGDVIRLQPDQIHYLFRVLRLKSGDRFIAQNGQGQQWLVALTEQAHQAQVIETLTGGTQQSAPIWLVAALPKGNHFDQVVRQTTELGVTHIQPVLSDRTLLKPSANKLARWQRIAQEASEQSERISVPEIFAPVAFQQFLEQRHLLEQSQAEQSQAEQSQTEQHQVKQSQTEQSQADMQTPVSATSEKTLRYICAARLGTKDTAIGTVNRTDSETNDPHLLAQLIQHQATYCASEKLPSIFLAIGPEGGWTFNEITLAISYGYETASLGSAILRAVTAPVTALSLVTAARELLI